MEEGSGREGEEGEREGRKREGGMKGVGEREREGGGGGGGREGGREKRREGEREGRGNREKAECDSLHRPTLSHKSVENKHSIVASTEQA